MKLIHTADLHLDAPGNTRLPPEKAQIRRQELLLNFGRLIAYAEENGVEIILIAGDLFDSPHPAPTAEQYVFDQIRNHPALTFLVLSGNHTGGYEPLNPPENYLTFPHDTVRCYDFGDLTVAGSENCAAYDSLCLIPSRLNIVMLHGQVGDRAGDPETVNPRYWAGRGIDYLALGHLHTARVEQLDTRGVWAYCGCPEGRGYDETGTKGFFLLNTEGGKITRTFIPFATRTIHRVPVDMASIGGQYELENAVRDALGTIPATDLVRVVLTGRVGADVRYHPTQLEQSLSQRYFAASVRDESRLAISPDTWRLDPSLRGEFVRQALAALPDEEERDRVIQCGLAALDGEVAL